MLLTSSSEAYRDDVGYAHLGKISVGPIGSVPLQSGWRRVAKRSFDLVIATLALIAVFPVLLLAALAIKLESRGPVIFRQARGGLNGNPFMILKLRTMFLADSDEYVRQATIGDPRITRIGLFLRKTSIDELPQLLNVLRGDMSIVGPRPHAVAHDRMFASLVEGYDQRLLVKPGITGLAQVRGLRGECKTVACIGDRVAADCEYARTATLKMDLAIMLQTLPRMLSDSRAY